MKDGDFILRAVCSKGTYIRTLVNDIGERLGTGAALSSLRRTAAGSFSVKDAHTIEEIKKHAEEGTLEDILKPVDILFGEYPRFILSEQQLRRCLCGNSFEAKAQGGRYRVYDEGGVFLMLGNVENGIMSTVKSFYEV